MLEETERLGSEDEEERSGGTCVSEDHLDNLGLDANMGKENMGGKCNSM